jgi:hypothetical protein
MDWRTVVRIPAGASCPEPPAPQIILGKDILEILMFLLEGPKIFSLTFVEQKESYKKNLFCMN